MMLGEFFFFFNDTATTEIYTLSLHDALPIFTHNPYAEWYLNSMRIDGSPTQVYHKEHYGADYDYYNFAPIFNRQIQKWRSEDWAKVFHDAGAKYVVLTTKHHDGFTLWPSSTPNPSLPADRQHASRDLVSELTAAVNQQGLRMGLYYSGGYDWTFVPGPIRVAADYQKVKPQSEAYGKYVFFQAEDGIRDLTVTGVQTCALPI